MVDWLVFIAALAITVGPFAFFCVAVLFALIREYIKTRQGLGSTLIGTFFLATWLVLAISDPWPARW